VGSPGGTGVEVLQPLWPQETGLCRTGATIHEAIAREKVLKKWKRAWKIELIEQANANWDDLFEVINA